jgi:DNA topoisomerase-3
MVFTSVRGHLMGVDFPEAYSNWQSHDPVVLFDAPIHKFVPEVILTRFQISYIIKNLKGVEKTLLTEARNCQALILWLDCDREGENIAFEVINVCSKSNPRLSIYRAHFSSLTPG